MGELNRVESISAGTSVDGNRSFPLDPSAISSIHDVSMHVLTHTGFEFAAVEAQELFRSHGFRVEGRRVFFREKDVLAALEKTPERFTIMARNPEHNLELSIESIAFGMGRGAVHMVEPEGIHRQGTCADHIALAKLCQSLDNMEHWGPLIYPGDVSVENAQLWMCRAMIIHLDKPYNYVDRHDIDLIALAYETSRREMIARDNLGRSCGHSTVTVLSPLSLTADACDNLMVYSQCGIAFHMASMPVAATTGPCALTGILVQQNCENLAPLVLAQLVRPGTPVFFGVLAGQANMRTMGVVAGSAEVRLMEKGGAQLARFYGLPCRGNVGITDSPICDFQAGAEAMMHMLNVVSNGPQFLTGCGLLGNYMGASLAKIVLDNELISYARRYAAGIQVDPETLALDVIDEVGPGGQYVTHPHTMDHCRMAFGDTTIFNRNDYDTWAQNDRRSALQAAHEKALRIIEDYQQPAMDTGLEEEIDAYVKRHWKDLG